jgi:Ca2+-binding RTX toxin-like protein
MGSSGDDLFILGTQGQGELPYRIDGGAGVDTLSLVDNTYFDATYGSFFTPGSVYTSAIISGFERFAANSGTVVGTTGNDDLIGSGTATMNGGDGNDEIWTNGQSNAIGGEGNDVIHGLGSGWIDGGGGNDVIYAGPETAFAYGGAGDDVIYAVGANTTVKDQFGTNQIHVSGGAQVHFNVDSYNTLVSMKDTGGGIYEIKTGTGTTYVDGTSEIYLDTYQGTSMIHLYAGLDYHDGMFF